MRSGLLDQGVVPGHRVQVDRVRRGVVPPVADIEDAPGRKVTQVDPITLYLLRQHNVIDADTLRAIANEKGVRITGGERAALIGGLCGASLVISLFTYALITGDIREAKVALRLPGDWDDDGHVDISDAFAFLDCLTGPGQLPPEDGCLTVFDFESDEDVDLRDFAEFQPVFDTP